MNDIDRSVDSFDFAMRRRFRFVELRADEHLEAINESIEDEGRRLEAIRRMVALNKEIVSVEDLNENYQIGAAYFAKHLISTSFGLIICNRSYRNTFRECTMRKEL